MRRRLPNVATSLSLLLCVAVVAVWVRGFFVGDKFFRWRFERDGEYTFWTADGLYLGRGGVGFSHFVQSHRRDDYPEQRAKVARREPPGHMTGKPLYPRFDTKDPQRLRFQYEWWTYGRTESGRPRVVSLHVVFPLWPIAAAAAVLPLVRGWKAWRRWRRAPAEFCAECRYDLRATPGRCPECGAVPARAGTQG